MLNSVNRGFLHKIKLQHNCNIIACLKVPEDAQSHSTTRVSELENYGFLIFSSQAISFNKLEFPELDTKTDFELGDTKRSFYDVFHRRASYNHFYHKYSFKSSGKIDINFDCNKLNPIVISNCLYSGRHVTTQRHILHGYFAHSCFTNEFNIYQDENHNITLINDRLDE